MKNRVRFSKYVEIMFFSLARKEMFQVPELLYLNIKCHSFINDKATFMKQDCWSIKALKPNDAVQEIQLYCTNNGRASDGNSNDKKSSEGSVSRIPKRRMAPCMPVRQLSIKDMKEECRQSDLGQNSSSPESMTMLDLESSASEPITVAERLPSSRPKLTYGCQDSSRATRKKECKVSRAPRLPRRQSTFEDTE